MKLDLLT